MTMPETFEQQLPVGAQLEKEHPFLTKVMRSLMEFPVIDAIVRELIAAKERPYLIQDVNRIFHEKDLFAPSMFEVAAPIDQNDLNKFRDLEKIAPDLIKVETIGVEGERITYKSPADELYHQPMQIYTFELFRGYLAVEKISTYNDNDQLIAHVDRVIHRDGNHDIAAIHENSLRVDIESGREYKDYVTYEAGSLDLDLNLAGVPCVKITRTAQNYRYSYPTLYFSKHFLTVPNHHLNASIIYEPHDVLRLSMQELMMINPNIPSYNASNFTSNSKEL